MTKKRWHLNFVLVVGTVFFLLTGGISSIRAEEKIVNPSSEVPLLLSIANKFTKTERPPVQFFHEKHANSLKENGCVVCHVPAEKGTLFYSFPAGKNEKNKNSLMNEYHTACIGCHEKMEKTGKTTGPITCGECHVVTAKTKKQAVLPSAEFDFSLHNLHSEASQGDCASCHHTGDKSSCKDCHGSVDKGQFISYRKAAHASCLKCHLEYEVGPSSCEGCHTGIKRSVKDLAETPRPNIGQPEQALIQVNGAKMSAVSFNHKEHEGYTTSCRTCHHNTMKNCNNCHTIKENSKGGNITLATAYHKTSSTRSCVGCHESKKITPQCQGCHQARKNGLTESSCRSCHRTSEDKTLCRGIIGDIANLLPKNLPDTLEINTLENKYLPVQFPHNNHIKKLTEISQKNKLADYFHCNQMSICMGCHHQSALYPEKGVPPCNTCHAINVQKKERVPALQAAFHRQCIACHKEMKIGPSSCNSGCHLPKKSEAAKGSVNSQKN